MTFVTIFVIIICIIISNNLSDIYLPTFVKDITVKEAHMLVRHFINYLILFIYSLILLSWSSPTAIVIISLCMALVVMLLWLLVPTHGYIYLSMIYLLTCLVLPSNSLFLILVTYGYISSIYPLIIKKSHPISTCCLPLLLYFAILIKQSANPNFASRFPLLLFIIVGCVISGLLAYHTSSYYDLQEESLKQVDHSRELNLALSSRNHWLIVQQNYEVYNATLKERNRIAREIHDNVGHILTRSILLTGALKAANKQSNLAHTFEDLDHALNEGMNSIRESVHDLHDNALNLEAELNKLAQTFDFCDITFSYHCESELPVALRYSFISIAKEGLSNIIKHSNATKASLLISEYPGFYQLILKDNGSLISQSSDGIGLINIKERVRTLDGNLSIDTTVGFVIHITVPKTSQIPKKGDTHENNHN